MRKIIKELEYLSKYHLKFHKSKEVVFAVLFCIFSFSFFYVSFLSDFSKSNKEYMQYDDYKIYSMEVKGEADDDREDIEKKVKRLQESMRNDSGIESIGYFPREIDDNIIKIEGAMLYCPAKNYQFDRNNLKQKKGFSDAANELIKVTGKHKVGEVVQGVVNQQETTFKIVDEVRNHCMVDFISNNIINLGDLKCDVYILNPVFYAQEPFFKCNSFGVFYLKTNALENDEYLLENGRFINKPNATFPGNICYDYGLYLQVGILICGIVIYIVLSCVFGKKKDLLYWNLLRLSKRKKGYILDLRIVWDGLSVV